MREVRVAWEGNPDVTGIVVDTVPEESVALVALDDDSGSEWFPVGELSEIDADIVESDDDFTNDNATNINAVYAPEIQDLEFTTRLHPKTHTLVMERAPNYRGGPGPVIQEPVDIRELFQYMSELDQEHIVIVLLDIRHQVIGWKVAHKGQLAGVEASVKDILKDAFLMNAAKVVILHNHPSGDPTPSDADAELTAALYDLGAEFDVELFDHVIIGRGDTPYFSFLEEGIIEPLVDDYQ